MTAVALDAHEGSAQSVPKRRLLRRVGAIVRPQRRRILLAVAMLVGQTACMLAGPLLVRYAIDHGILHDDLAALDVAGVTFLVVAAAGFFFARQAILLVGLVGETFLRELRGRVFRHLMGLGLDYFEKEQTGRLVARMTSDIDALQELVQTALISLVQNTLLFLGALVVVLLLSWQLALVLLVAVPPIYLATRWFQRRGPVAYRAVREHIGHNLANFQEGLAGVRVVQAFAREDASAGRFQATNEAQFDANMHAVRISIIYFPFLDFCGIAVLATIVGLGGVFVDQGIATVGTVAAVVLYVNNLFEPMQQIGQLYNLAQAAAAALDKLFDLLDTEPSIAERPAAVELPASGDLAVHDASFAYGAYDVLRHVTLTIAPGERLALVGPTGAGKSTLAKLVARFYDPREGSVTFGGVDLRDAAFTSLRQRIVVVPQENFLFAGTVRENVRVGRMGATDADVDAAVDALGLRERFESLPEGLATEVRERGSRLSAGERQLVSLARAALADPAVLVLDEATSNLDPGTEEAVEQALERLTAGRTVVVVAHRLSTAARADRIGVVDGGRLVELGTHEELVAGSGRYASLFASWSVAGS